MLKEIGEDAFVRKHDASGTLRWVRPISTTNADAAHGLSVNSTGVYGAGRTAGPLGGAEAALTGAFVAKYNDSGTQQWTRQFGTGTRVQLTESTRKRMQSRFRVPACTSPTRVS